MGTPTNKPSCESCHRAGSSDRDRQGRRGPRAGRIHLSFVALALLILAVSLCLSAWRSLGRQFSGRVVFKVRNAGLIDSHLLYLAPAGEPFPVASHEAASAAAPVPAGGGRPVAPPVQPPLAGTPAYGVSSVVYEHAEIGDLARKDRHSPWIWLGEQRHLDLGVHWMFLGVLGVAAALAMYRQILARPVSPGDRQAAAPDPAPST